MAVRPASVEHFQPGVVLRGEPTPARLILRYDKIALARLPQYGESEMRKVRRDEPRVVLVGRAETGRAHIVGETGQIMALDVRDAVLCLLPLEKPFAQCQNGAVHTDFFPFARIFHKIRGNDGAHTAEKLFRKGFFFRIAHPFGTIRYTR